MMTALKTPLGGLGQLGTGIFSRTAHYPLLLEPKMRTAPSPGRRVFLIFSPGKTGVQQRERPTSGAATAMFLAATGELVASGS